MKKLTLMIAACLLTAATFAQSKYAEKFHNKYKDDRDATVVSLNGSIFELLGTIASFGEDEDSETFARIAKGIKSMRVLSLPIDKIGIAVNEIDDLRKNILGEGYDELMTVREGQERVYFLAKTSDKEINNMLILVNDGNDEFVLMNLDGVLNMQDLAYLAKHRKDWGE